MRRPVRSPPTCSNRRSAIRRVDLIFGAITGPLPTTFDRCVVTAYFILKWKCSIFLPSV
jgi:hypothetical protein